MKHVAQFLLATAGLIGFEIGGGSSPGKLAAVTKARLEQVQKIVNDAGISIQ